MSDSALQPSAVGFKRTAFRRQLRLEIEHTVQPERAVPLTELFYLSREV